MRILPFRGTHWPGSYFDYQVAHHETGMLRHCHEVAMRPPLAMIVDDIRDLGEQNAIRHQYTLGLRQERWIQIAEAPSMLFATLYSCSEVDIEPLGAFVPSLGPHMWWVIDDYGKGIIGDSGHCAVVCDDVWLIAGINVHRRY